LLENCLDAHATTVSIVAKNGGLKSLQITDNGHGIRKDDLERVCERFTTSKLRKFADLETIGTYGFRGEALASISHVSRVTITTRTADSECGYVAKYINGKLKGEIKTVAAQRGTTVLAEDMFYNMNVRKGALGTGGEEHARLVDVVQKYAIHNPAVSFLVKKVGNTKADAKTPGGQNRSSKDVVSVLYGQNISNDLTEFKAEHQKEPKMKWSGLLSNANFSQKRLSFILFINHRLVDCTAMKRNVEHVFEKNVCCFYVFHRDSRKSPLAR
jgi:DNA mismatch repair protein MLH1